MNDMDDEETNNISRNKDTGLDKKHDNLVNIFANFENDSCQGNPDDPMNPED